MLVILFWALLFGGAGCFIQFEPHTASAKSFGSNGRDFPFASTSIVRTDGSVGTVIVGTFESTMAFSRADGSILELLACRSSLDQRSRICAPSVFVVELDPSGNAVWAAQSHPSTRTGIKPSSATAFDVAVDQTTGETVVVGTFAHGAIRFGNVTLHPRAKENNAFVVKYEKYTVDRGRKEPGVAFAHSYTASLVHYAKSVAVDSKTGLVVVGGSFQGHVIMGKFKLKPLGVDVQGWLGGLRGTDGTPQWVNTVIGTGRNFVTDVRTAPANTLAVVGTYEGGANMTRLGVSPPVRVALNGTTARSLFVLSLDLATGAVRLLTTAQSPSCAEYHRIAVDPGSGDLFVAGCFVGNMTFTCPASTQQRQVAQGGSGRSVSAPGPVYERMRAYEPPPPFNERSTCLQPTVHTLVNPYNKVYVARFLASDLSVVWGTSLGGQNVLDYLLSIALDLQQRPIVCVFISGPPYAGYVRLDPETTATAVGAGGLYVSSFNANNGSVRYLVPLMNGRAGGAGLHTTKDSFLHVAGAFSGSVSFGHRAPVHSIAGSVDLFAASFQLRTVVVNPVPALAGAPYETVALAVGAAMVLAGTACLARIYWRPPLLDRTRNSFYRL